MTEANNKTESYKTVLERMIGGLRLVVKSTQDKEKLFIDSFIENKDTLPSLSDIKNIILEVCPEELIHEDVIKDIFDNHELGKNAENRRVARARAPKPGINGKLVLLVKAYGKRGENDAYDPRFIRMFDNIVPETSIARLYPPKPGVDGLDVLGKPLPPQKVTEYKLKLNGNLELVDSPGNPFQVVLSKGYGYIEESSGQLTLKDELVLSSDVDYRIGDIDFMGKINIKGSVMSGFFVSAKDDIQISGDVQGGGVISAEGSIIIKGSVLQGSGQGTAISNKSSSTLINSLVSKPSKNLQISAAKGLQVNQLDNATVSCGGYLEVAKGVFNSTIKTRASLIMPEGYLVGGITRAVCGVDAKIIGSPGHATTTIILTSSAENSPEYEDLQQKIKSCKEAEELIELHLGPLASADRTRLNKESLAKFKQMELKLASVRATLEELSNKAEELLKNTHYNAVLRINFRKTLHEGTIIKAGKEEFIADKDYTGPGTIEFLREEKKFVISPLKPLECEYDSENKVSNKGVNKK